MVPRFGDNNAGNWVIFKICISFSFIGIRSALVLRYLESIAIPMLNGDWLVNNLSIYNKIIGIVYELFV